MDIKFTDQFDKECRDKFGIPRQVVREAIETSSDSEEIIYKGLQLEFYTKEIDKNQLLLILARKTDSQIVVDLAFKIKEDLAKALKIRRPISILQKLIEKYGLVVVVGGVSRKFIVAQEINIKPEQTSKLLEVKNPDNHSFTASMFIKINEDRTKAECALAFALDVNRYLEWIND